MAALQVLAPAPAHARHNSKPTAEDPCLANLPVPVPIPPAVRVVQLVNCSSEVLLGAANAAARSGQPITSVFPREGTWVMQPYPSPTNANVLTIDIPPEWADTGPKGSAGPNIWARTGCRYDEVADRAQCETGGAGGVYDISKAKLGPPAGATITEWNFFQAATLSDGTQIHFDNFDISAVNGVNLTVDIQPVGGSALNPRDPNDPFWLAKNYPMSAHGEDLRASNRCPPAFRLLRSQMSSSGIYGSGASGFPPTYGFVILGDNGQPVGGDATVACFSNCGKYEFPLTPLDGCDLSDPRCFHWSAFCAGQGQYFGQKCNQDSDCELHASCWINPGSPTDHTCQNRAFITAPCSPDVCTFPYGFINPVTGQPETSTQPPFAFCSAIDPVNTNSFCIGDDTVHEVFPHAYSWPNDPQTYGDDAPLYRIIFAPGGTSEPITPSAKGLPLCSSLSEKIYGYSAAHTNCSIPISQGAVFAVARAVSNPAPENAWSCNVLTASGNDGVVCRWTEALSGGPPSFAGVPGQANCKGKSKSALAHEFGGLNDAASGLGFSSVKDLDQAVDDFCR